MLSILRTTKGRIAIATIASIALAVLWMIYDDMSIAILPALIVPFWIPLFTRQREPVSPRANRLLLASVAIGALLVLILAAIYLSQR